MRIADGVSRLPAGYIQRATAVDLEKMILAIAPSHTQLLILSQSADRPIPELSH